ncbi:MAG: GntR family transcriptional regulator [Gammaproteobacteria bacterium]|nr:GntR family transcriptional regulator [Gammaproteobacteria bacterium]|tara:strand:- start:21527 stop:23008 length:1482 start_codon:yes stop_codon:yes gene_type:complete
MNQFNQIIRDKPASAEDLQLNPRAKGQKIQQWLDRELRRLILQGQIRGGEKLPSTRKLAQLWSIARGTVITVYEQLVAEGYLESRQGSGFYVVTGLTEDIDYVLGENSTRESQPERPDRNEINYKESPFPVQGDFTPKAFSPFQPDCDLFPRVLWGRIMSSLCRQADASIFRFGEAAGYRPLREAISQYLARSRGVKCSAEQVIITSGTQQSLQMISQILLREGDNVIVEDPLYRGARTIFSQAEFTLNPVPVDKDGLTIEKLHKIKTSKLIFTTPTNQCPLGVVLSLERRFQLLDYAQKNQAYIFEDDYDGEFRYTGQPLPALQGLDKNNRVIYAGTFNKTMYASLRLGYLVLPPELFNAALHYRATMDRFPPGLEQAAMSTFLQEGHYNRHLRRMRKVYAGRLKALQEAVASYLPELQIGTRATGLETLAWLPQGSDDRKVCEKLAEQGIRVQALKNFCLQQKLPPALVMGFAAITEKQIRQGIKTIARCL